MEFPERDALRTKLLNQQITLAVASDDRAGALSWIRESLKADANLDLALEWLQARAELDRLLRPTAGLATSHTTFDDRLKGGLHYTE